MSELVKASAEFLSRDSSTKQSRELEEDFTKMKDHELKQWITTRQMNAMGGNLTKQRKDQYDQAQAELKRRKTNLKEEAHKVSVTVSDPNHTMVTKRNERMEKRVIVKADNKDEAVVKAKEFYKKKGLKVHSAEYHSPQPTSSLN